MTKRRETRGHDHFSTTTAFGPRPGDFPVGSVQSRAAARALISGTADERDLNAIEQLGPLNEIEQAMIDDDNLNPLARFFVVSLYRCALHRAEVYDMPLPLLTPEMIRRTWALHKEIDRMTGGESRYTNYYDYPEWNRLRAIAEQNLDKKEK